MACVHPKPVLLLQIVAVVWTSYQTDPNKRVTGQISLSDNPENASPNWTTPSTTGESAFFAYKWNTRPGTTIKSCKIVGCTEFRGGLMFACKPNSQKSIEESATRRRDKLIKRRLIKSDWFKRQSLIASGKRDARVGSIAAAKWAKRNECKWARFIMFRVADAHQ